MSRFRRYCIAYGLLLWLFGALMVGAQSLSLTLDEPIHIAAGYALLARGRDALWILPLHGHPPLLNLLEAALVYLEKPSIPLENLNGWGSGLTEFMWAFAPYLRPLERTELLARTPIMWLTILLGALVFRWARELWGLRAGLIALAVLCFDPLLLAHGRLATTDGGTVALGTAGLYALWRWMKAPSWGRALIAGGLLGLTMLAKGSGVFWTAAAALLALWTIVKSPQRRGTRLTQSIAAGLISLIILWGGYGFTWGPVGNMPGSYPAPAHWIGLLNQAGSVEGRWVFALGLRKHGHWWWYFPLAFVLKNPIPFLIAAPAGGIALLRRMRLTGQTLTLLVFPTIYMAVSVARGMNIGYRHMLPIHPTMYLLVSYGVSCWIRPSRIRQAITIALGTWYALGTILVFPYEIAYFNELIGGPRNGHYYLVDANVDWGQGYKALRRYLEEHPGPTPKLAPPRFTYIRPEDYGISAVLLPPADGALPLQAPFHPAPGRYIISITTLQLGWPADNGIYAWFRQAQPVATVGYSFFVYDVHSPPLEWFAQCESDAPLDTSLIAWGFGKNDLRQVYFDCRSAWIYPTGGRQMGAYGLHHELVPQKRPFFSLLPSLPQANDPFVARRLADLRLSLNMDRYTERHPAFVLYEQEQMSRLPSPQPVALSAGEWPVSLSTPYTTPLVLNGPLTFLGALAYRYEEQFDVETWWQVTGGPITRPLSIMAHLLDADGKLLGQNDGLGVSPVLWQSGDIIVQRHRFSRPPDDIELWLRTGVYWLDTMERWPVAHTPSSNVILVPFGKR